jgi:hypothetical protein
VIDSAGNNLLHQVTIHSIDAARFIEKLATQISEGKTPHLDVGNRYNYPKDPLTNAINSDGQTWLEILVDKGDVRSLDLALSPNRRFACDITQSAKYINISSLKDCIQRTGHPIMQLIVDTFDVIFDMQQILCSVIRGTAKEQFTSECMMPVQVAKFVRFVCDWKKRKHFDDPLSLTVKRGHPDLFKLFQNVDKRFWNDTTCVPRNEDRNEYIQPELSSELFSGVDWVDVSNYIACVIGFGEVRYKVENVRAEEIYLSAVRGHFNGKSCKSDCSSLLCHLERDSKCGFRWGREEGYSTFLEYKISLLKDSPQLVGRLEILTHVLLERPAEIDVLMVLRYRQCGVMGFFDGCSNTNWST